MRTFAAALLALSIGTAFAQSGPPPGGAPPPGGPAGSGGPTGAAAGPSPVIDSIQFSGDTRFTPAQLATVLTQHPGESVSRPGVQADLQALRGMYRQPGRPKARIMPNITHPAPGHVVITYVVTER